MRIASLWIGSLLVFTLDCGVAHADPSISDDRIAVSVNGSTLTGTNGGAGASLGWLHNFTPGSIAGIAVEHQALAGSQWTFGSLSGSVGLGPENQRYNVYGEVHEGGGVEDTHSFRYEIEAAGVIGTFNHKLSAQLEDRRVDVENSHGNLPKAGLSYLWGPHVMTTAAYQYTVSGNLGTRVTSARLDVYASKLNIFAGTAFGPASPAVLNIATNIVNNGTSVVTPARELHEEYVGVSKPFARWHSELTLTADYLDLSGIVRASLTLTYIFHIGG
jgi:hypothetical protein